MPEGKLQTCRQALTMSLERVTQEAVAHIVDLLYKPRRYKREGGQLMLGIHKFVLKLGQTCLHRKRRKLA